MGLLKKILFILTGVIILSAVIVYHHNTEPGAIISRLALKDNSEFHILRYRINLFGVIPVGVAEFLAIQPDEFKGNKAYHLIANATSLDYIAGIFKGKVSLDSYVDREKFTPFVFRQKIEIANKPEISKEIIYDQKNTVMQVNGVRRKILPNTYDSLSAIFLFMKMDLALTKNFDISINNNKKNYILEGTTFAQAKSVNKSIYRLVTASGQLRRRDKNPYHKTTLKIVFLQGKNNIPISINVFASGVLLNACLIDRK